MTTPTKEEDVAARYDLSSTPSPRATDNPAKPIHLIFVDDDDDYREAATGELMDLGFSVESFASGEAMLKSFDNGVDADVIVLDWGLPALSGIDLVPRLRRQGIFIPVVFLTGRGSQAYESMAFDHGALDFVDKSRGLPILAKRLRLIVDAAKRRPTEIALDETVHCGRLVLKPRTSRAFWGGTDLNLTLTEFNIVRLLASNPGNHVTYRAVYDCMHHVGFIGGSGQYGYRTNVRSSIKRIRNKFRTVDPDFDEIENYPSFGYRWGRQNEKAVQLPDKDPSASRSADP
jgi:two-component system, OmpR family, response regulator ChvI